MANLKMNQKMATLLIFGNKIMNIAGFELGQKFTWINMP